MNLWLLSYWGLNRGLLGRGRLRGCGRGCGGLRSGGGGLLGQQLRLVQARGQRRLLRLLVEVLDQGLLRASLGRHGERGDRGLLGCGVYGLKLLGLGLGLRRRLLVERARGLLGRRLLGRRLLLGRLLEEERLLVLRCGLRRSRRLLRGRGSLGLLGLRLG